jgi:hypothetical protein
LGTPSAASGEAVAAASAASGEAVAAASAASGEAVAAAPAASGEAVAAASAASGEAVAAASAASGQQPNAQTVVAGDSAEGGVAEGGPAGNARTVSGAEQQLRGLLPDNRNAMLTSKEIKAAAQKRFDEARPLCESWQRLVKHVRPARILVSVLSLAIDDENRFELVHGRCWVSITDPPNTE